MTQINVEAAEDRRDHRQRKLTGIQEQIVRFIAIGLSLFQLSIALYPITAERLRVTHVCLSFILIFFLYPLWQKKKRNRLALDGIILAVMTLAASFYAFFFWFERAQDIGLKPPFIELILGAVMILLALEAARRTVGYIFPIITIVILFYARFGESLPDLFAHPNYDLERIIASSYLTTEGVYGMLTGVSATFIYIFILFGSFLRESGAGDFFIKLSYSLLGKVRGGPAKIAVIASSMFGIVSGSTLANVAGTGQLTIPLMKRTGYQPHFAGGVEAVSSAGGQIMPPILGGSVFIMMEILGISYLTIMIATLFLGILYYFTVFVMVDLEAAKIGLKGLSREELPKFSETLKEGWHFCLPLLLLIFYLAVIRTSPTKAAFYAVISIPIVAIFRKSTRIGLSDILRCLERGAYAALPVVGIIVCSGILVGMITLTGLGLLISSILIELAHGSLLLLLILTMISSIILGMGVPIMAAYVVLAILVAPALIQTGVVPLAAHLFVLYFAVMSAITPPVAPDAFVAAGIANANQFKTAITACRIGLAGFVLPYLLVYHPVLLLQGQFFTAFLVFSLSLFGLYALAGANQNHLLLPTNIIERFCLAFCAFSFFQKNIFIMILGAVLLVSIILRQRRKKLMFQMEPVLP